MKEQINELLKKVGLKAEEIKLAQMKGADGVTVFEAEAFEAGQSVGVVTEEGAVAVPVGEYELEDGKILVVQEEGIIAEIKEAVSEEAAEEEGEMMDEKKEEMSEAPAPKKVVESVTKESFFSKALHDALVNEITELKAQLAEKEEVKEEVEMSSEEPSTEPITHNPENESQKVNFKYATSRSASTFDRVMAKIANS
jgi:hypothetical protein